MRLENSIKLCEKFPFAEKRHQAQMEPNPLDRVPSDERVIVGLDFAFKFLDVCCGSPVVCFDSWTIISEKDRDVQNVKNLVKGRRVV